MHDDIIINNVGLHIGKFNSSLNFIDSTNYKYRSVGILNYYRIIHYWLSIIDRYCFGN